MARDLIFEIGTEEMPAEDMDFVRKIVDSDSLKSLISLPNKLKHKKVEVLILPLNEQDKTADFNPEEFKGVFDFDSRDLDKELKNLRDEWERV
jgi:hypothetical protein